MKKKTERFMEWDAIMLIVVILMFYFDRLLNKINKKEIKNEE